MRTQLAALVVVLTIGLAASGFQATARAERCPDLNHDGVVDAADLQIIADHWRAEPGTPSYLTGLRYNGSYDLNHDQHISLVDAAIVALHWQEDCR